MITAKAYSNNASRPIPVRVGNEEQTLVLGNEVTTTTLHFDNPTDADTLVIATGTCLNQRREYPRALAA